MTAESVQPMAELELKEDLSQKIKLEKLITNYELNAYKLSNKLITYYIRLFHYLI